MLEILLDKTARKYLIFNVNDLVFFKQSGYVQYVAAYLIKRQLCFHLAFWSPNLELLLANISSTLTGTC